MRIYCLWQIVPPLENKIGIGGSTAHALFKFPFKIYESEPAFGKALTEL